MPVQIETELYPLRLSLKTREPSTVNIKITNNGAAPALLSLELFLPRELGFDKSALNKGARTQLGLLKPKESKETSFKVYLNPPLAKEGVFTAELNVLEHYKDYKQIVRNYRKDIDFRIA
jgi:hypothetical protein